MGTLERRAASPFLCGRLVEEVLLALLHPPRGDGRAPHPARDHRRRGARRDARGPARRGPCRRVPEDARAARPAGRRLGALQHRLHGTRRARGPRPPLQHVLQDPALRRAAAEGDRPAAEARRDPGAVQLPRPWGGRRDAADHGVGSAHAPLPGPRSADGRDHERRRRRRPRPPAVRQSARAHDRGLGGEAGSRLRDDDGRREAAALGRPRGDAAPPLLLVHRVPAVRAHGAPSRRSRPSVRSEGLPDRGPQCGPRARAALHGRRPEGLRREARPRVHAGAGDARDAGRLRRASASSRRSSSWTRTARSSASS